MAVILCAHIDKQTIKAFGNWFTLAPGRPKIVDDKLARFIVEKGRDQGFVMLPEEAAEVPTNEKEAKKYEEMVKAATAQGRTNIVNSLRYRIRNLEVSMQRDLDKANMKYSPMIEASADEEKAYELLIKFNELSKVDSSDKEERLKKLKEKADGVA